MKPIPSYVQYLKMLSDSSEADLREDSYYLEKQFYLNTIHQQNSFATFVLDYRKRNYPLLTKNIIQVCSHSHEAFKEGGSEIWLNMMHEKDRSIFNKEVFKSIIGFFSSIAPEDHPNYRVSYSLRIKDIEGSYQHVLQQSSYIKSDTTGKPLLNFGTVCNISPFKSDQKITLCIERLNETGKFETVLSNFYFPEEKEGVLTKREIEILKWIVEGLQSSEIANKLHVATHTVHTHRKNLMAKTNAKNIAELIKYAIKARII